MQGALPKTKCPRALVRVGSMAVDGGCQSSQAGHGCSGVVAILVTVAMQDAPDVGKVHTNGQANVPAWSLPKTIAEIEQFKCSGCKEWQCGKCTVPRKQSEFKSWVQQQMHTNRAKDPVCLMCMNPPTTKEPHPRPPEKNRRETPASGSSSTDYSASRYEFP